MMGTELKIELRNTIEWLKERCDNLRLIQKERNTTTLRDALSVEIAKLYGRAMLIQFNLERWEGKEPCTST